MKKNFLNEIFDVVFTILLIINNVKFFHVYHTSTSVCFQQKKNTESVVLTSRANEMRARERVAIFHARIM
jgi:hypothetical protein